MLGSLVLIYPTAHEGGELVLRHKDHEWKFDANSLTDSQSAPSLAYVAFYSDLEHEVLKVTSGRRITVTYNLYLVDPVPKPGAPIVTLNSKSVSNLQAALQESLESPKFLPDGGKLGFGLAHLYPVTFNTKLEDLMGYLKGADADVCRACRALDLQPSLQMIYDDKQSDYDGLGIMLDTITQAVYYDPNLESYESTLVTELGGVPVNKTEKAKLKKSRWVEEGVDFEFITWVSPFVGRNQLQDVTVALRSDVSTDIIYCSPCLIVDVPAAVDRV